MKNFLLLLGFVLVIITSFDYSNELEKREKNLNTVCTFAQQKLGASLQLAIELCREIGKELTTNRKEKL